MNTEYLNALATTIMMLSERGINTFDFANSFRGKQIESKKWLVDHIISPPKNVLILGSWYGTVLPYLLKEKFDVRIIDCVDCDPNVRFGAQVFCDVMGWNNVIFHEHDAKDYLQVCGVEKYDLVINTSCEHMKFDMKEVIEPNTIYALESNNYYGIDGHINCKHSLDEFKKSTGLSNIVVSEEKDMQNYTRYLVIGSA